MSTQKGKTESARSAPIKRKKIAAMESPLTDAIWSHMSEEAQLAWMLGELQKRYLQDPASAGVSFAALKLIAAYQWQKAMPADAHQYIEVPWWIVDSIAAGFALYEEALKAGQKLTLGQALRIEPKGKGSKRFVTQEANLNRDIRIAMRLAKAEAEGGKIEAEIQAISDETGMSLANIKAIWRNNSKRARQKAPNIR